MLAKKPIAIFDSGIGGLTVFEQISKQLPAESLIYFADTGHVPYGSKSADVVRGYASEIVDFLQDQEVKLIVCACNTASSVAIDTLRQRCPIPIIEVISPTVEIARQQGNRIGVIGTKATIGSNIYPSKLGSNIQSMACPLFVPLVEEGWHSHPIAHQIANEYLSSFIGAIDTLILGCTHYPLLRPIIKQILGPSVTIIDSAAATANQVKRWLSEQNLLNQTPADHTFWVSDDPANFQEMVSRLFPTLLPSSTPPPIRKYTGNTHKRSYQSV